MAEVIIPQVEFKPALIDPLDEALMSPDWSCKLNGQLPSPSPIGEIGRITNQSLFSQSIDLIPLRPNPRTDRENCLTIMLPVDDGQVRYELPDELEQFYESIGLVAAHEHTHYPDRRYEEARLILQQSPVKAGNPQRTASDRVPYIRNGHRDPYHRAYEFADVNPTKHAVSELPINAQIIGKDDRQPMPEGVTVFQADPYEIAQCNPLSLHWSPPFEEDGDRTFGLLRYTYKR